MTVTSSFGLAFTLPPGLVWRIAFLLLTLTMILRLLTISMSFMRLHGLSSLMPSFTVRIIAKASPWSTLIQRMMRSLHDAGHYLSITQSMKADLLAICSMDTKPGIPVPLAIAEPRATRLVPFTLLMPRLLITLTSPIG